MRLSKLCVTFFKIHACPPVKSDNCVNLTSKFLLQSSLSCDYFKSLVLTIR